MEVRKVIGQEVMAVLREQTELLREQRQLLREALARDFGRNATKSLVGSWNKLETDHFHPWSALKAVRSAL